MDPNQYPVLPGVMIFASPLRGRPRLAHLVFLSVGFAFFWMTRFQVAFFDDESKVILGATAPVEEMFRAYFFEKGRYHHPPLADFLLHLWLPFCNGDPQMVRVPYIFFFLLGLLILAFVAKRPGEARPPATILALGILWPFGFYMGRAAGWYTLAFFLVSSLTYFYESLTREYSRRTARGALVSAFFLVHLNYFGVCLLAFLVFDWLFFVRRDKATLRFIGTFGSLLVLSLVPLLPAVSSKVSGVSLAGERSFFGEVLYASNGVFAALLSDSIAPWHAVLSIPATIALVFFFREAWNQRADRPLPMRLAGYFFTILGLMVLLKIFDTKRLILISPWLILLVFSQCARPGVDRRKSLAAIAVVFGIGWFGIWRQEYSSTFRYLEPWDQIASLAKSHREKGFALVAVNPAFFFRLKYAVQGGLVPNTELAGLYTPESANQAGGRIGNHVFYIRTAGEDASKLEWENWLAQHCTSGPPRIWRLDNGAQIKKRFFPSVHQPTARIETWEYSCASPPTTGLK